MEAQEKNEGTLRARFTFAKNRLLEQTLVKVKYLVEFLNNLLLTHMFLCGCMWAGGVGGSR